MAEEYLEVKKIRSVAAAVQSISGCRVPSLRSGFQKHIWLEGSLPVRFAQGRDFRKSYTGTGTD